MFVAEINNSSPGKPGFKLALCSDGEMHGTIGGGPMEFKLVEDAKRILNANQKIRTVRTLLHKRGGIGEKSGLICGGKQTTILFSVDKSSNSVIKKIVSRIEQQKKSLLKINDEKISIHDGNSSEAKIEFSKMGNNKFEYCELIGNPNRLLIFGGGHIGLALSKLMTELDFYVIAFDSRENVSTVKKNIFADKIIITSYEKIPERYFEGENIFVVVVTTECHSDYTVLKKILPRRFNYIGLMGSRTKTKNIFHQLKLDGFSSEALKKIHTPIGININAKTPEEIAISIAAELISVKNSFC